MSKRHNPIASEPGYVASRINPETGEPIVLYDGPLAGFADKPRWVVVCALHGTIIAETNQRRARSLLRAPEAWCECCKTVAEPVPSVHIIPFRQKTPDEQEQELRIMAQRTKNDPEKVELFEKVYGVSPRMFWN